MLYYLLLLLLLSQDNYMFARCAAYIGDRASLTEERLPGINTIVMDEELTAAIGQAAKVSMGMDASPLDMSNVVTFTERMVKLAEYRKVRSYILNTVLQNVLCMSA
jgi:nucleolar protein 56